MSGFVRDEDMGPSDASCDGIEVREGRTARLGAMGIVRALPTKGRRTIGAWSAPETRAVVAASAAIALPLAFVLCVAVDSGRLTRPLRQQLEVEVQLEI